MISPEEIGGLIKHPQQISTVAEADLTELINKHPFCSSLHLLLLLRRAEGSDLHFEDHLKNAAIHIPDRQRLFQHINNDLIHSTSTETQSIGEITAETTPVKEESRDVETQPQELTPSTENPGIAQESSDAKVIDPKKEEEETEIKESIAEQNDDGLEQDILISAVGAAFELTGEIEEEDSSVPVHETLEEIVHQSDESKAESKEKAETAPQEKQPKNLTFIQWLQFKQGKIDQGQSALREIADEISTDDLPVIGFGFPEREEKQKMTKNEIDALLNKFIAEEPSISKPKKEFFSPSKSAKQSLEEPVDLVSETLARIHVMQKNYDKAIAAYEQLSLLYPEKKVFFASQIEKIKTEINKQS